jgi:hypothetical protein
VDFASLALDWNFTKEIFKRRNAIVHTAGRTNQDYASSVSDASPIGTSLDCSDSYTFDALEQLITLGCLVALRIWRLCDESDAPLSFVWMTADELYRNRFWRGAAQLYRFIRSNTTREDWRTGALLNEWSARIEGGDSSRLQEELATYTTKELPSLVQLAVQVALRKLDDAFAGLAEQLENGKFTIIELRSYSIFKVLVTDARFEAFNEKNMEAVSLPRWPLSHPHS